MNPRLALSLYLLKSGVSPSTALASGVSSEGERESLPWLRAWSLEESGPVELSSLPQALPLRPVLVLRATKPEDSWLTFLVALFSVGDLPLDRANFSALMFHSIEPNLFVVWSFGSGWSLLNQSATVARFGLKAGLNALLSSSPPPEQVSKPVGVRSMTSAIRAKTIRKATILATRPSKPSAMERVDRSIDAAASAELTTDHPVFKTISIGRSLRFEASVDSLEQLAEYAREAYRLYQRDDYLQDEAYRWIDYTVPVEDPTEVVEVLKELWRQATDESPLEVNLVWAEAETNAVSDYVCFPGERSGPHSAKRRELLWGGLKSWLQKKDSHAHDGLWSSLRFYDTQHQQTVKVEVWELLIAQLSLGEKTYFVSDGAIWLVNPSFIAQIDQLLDEQLEVNPSWLPLYQLGEREDSYNTRAAKEHGHLLLDKQLVHLKQETPFEPCDLLSRDGYLMHVKRKSNSSKMSHLTGQALSSTSLLRSSSDARDLVCQAVAQKDTLPESDSFAMRSHISSFAGVPTAKVILVIIGHWKGTPTVRQLPLLTRVNLHGWLVQMLCPRAIVLVGT